MVGAIHHGFVKTYGVMDTMTNGVLGGVKAGVSQIGVLTALMSMGMEMHEGLKTGDLGRTFKSGWQGIPQFFDGSLGSLDHARRAWREVWKPMGRGEGSIHDAHFSTIAELKKIFQARHEVREAAMRTHALYKTKEQGYTEAQKIAQRRASEASVVARDWVMSVKDVFDKAKNFAKEPASDRKVAIGNELEASLASLRSKLEIMKHEHGPVGHLFESHGYLGLAAITERVELIKGCKSYEAERDRATLSASGAKQAGSHGDYASVIGIGGYQPSVGSEVGSGFQNELKVEIAKRLGLNSPEDVSNGKIRICMASYPGAGAHAGSCAIKIFAIADGDKGKSVAIPVATLGGADEIEQMLVKKKRQAAGIHDLGGSNPLGDDAERALSLLSLDQVNAVSSFSKLHDMFPDRNIGHLQASNPVHHEAVAKFNESLNSPQAEFDRRDNFGMTVDAEAVAALFVSGLERALANKQMFNPNDQRQFWRDITSEELERGRIDFIRKVISKQANVS
jgi:hypothetical protein